MVPEEPQFYRGNVFRIRFHPPDEPQAMIEKYIVNLQEGRIVANSPTFVGVMVTTKRLDHRYPWDVFVTEEECHYSGGAKIICSQVHTIPKEDILDFQYRLSNVTMDEVDQKLLLGIGIAKVEELELLEEMPEEEAL